MEDSNRQLLKQFCRGCWDQSIIISLQLEQKKVTPPSFPELLLILRTEEEKRLAKFDRMKKHLGSSKNVSQAQAQSLYGFHPYSEEQGDQVSDTITKLTKQIAEMQAQLAAVVGKVESKTSKYETASKKKKPALAVDNNASSTQNFAVNISAAEQSKPRPWYCFRCGMDGHIARECQNLANPRLVSEKTEELKGRRAKWWSQQNAKSPASLNM